MKLKDENSKEGEQKSDLNYDQLFGSLGIGLIEHDSNGVIINADVAAQQLLGLSLEQLQGKESIDENWESIHPDGSPFPGDQHPIMEVVRTGKPILNIEMGIYHPRKKHHVWLLVNTVPLFHQNEKIPYKIITTFTDISERIDFRLLFKRQLELQELLTKVSRVFISVKQNEISEVIQQSLADLGRFIQVDRFYIFDYDFEKKLASNTYEWCEEGISAHIHEMQNVPLQEFLELVEIHKKGETILIDDVLSLPEDSHLKALMLPQQVKSAIAVPLMDAENCVGFIGLDVVKKHHKFSVIEQTLLNVFASILVNVQIRFKSEVALLRSQQNLQDRYKELNCIFEISQIGGVEDIDISEFFQKVVDIIPSGFQFPEKTSARILYNEEIFKSLFYKESDNKISIQLSSNLNNKCLLEVSVPQDISFIDEERNLILNLKKNIELRFDKKRVKEELRRSERKYKIIADNNYHWEFWNGHDGKFIYHSPACMKITGYSAQELLESNELYESIIHPDDLEFFKAHHANIRQQRGFEKHHFRIISKSKELKHIEHVCQPIFDEKGKFLGIRGTNIDITDRILSEETLRNSEERLRNLVNSQTNYVVRTDLKGNYTYWNKKYKEDFEWIYLEEISDDFHTFNSLHAVIPEHHIRVIETVQKCLSNPGEIVKVEFDKRYKNSGVMNTLWEFVAITDAQNVPIEIQCMGIDITNRKVIETKLEESERKYKTLFEKSPDANLIIKEDIFIDCNDVAVEMIGGTREDIIGKSPCKLSPSIQPNGIDTYEFSSACYKKIKEGSHSFEWLHVKKDGTPFWTYVKLTAISFEGEDVLFCSWRDITESKKLQEKLIISENRFSEIAEHSRSVIWELDLNGRYVYLNSVVESVFGYKPEELLGRDSYEMHPADLKEQYKGLAETLLKEHKGIINFENPIQRKDGEVVWVSTSSTPVYDENNNVIKYVGTDVDITERKKAEEELNKFRIIADQANIGTAITTLEGIITYCNDMFAQLHGFDKGELLGANLVKLHNESQLPRVFELLDVIKNQGGFSAEELDHCRKDGSTFPTLMSAKVIFDEKNRPKFMSATLIDITEKKKAEQEILKFRVLADQANYGVVLASLDGVLEYCNAAFASMHGWNVEDLIDKHFSMFYHNNSDLAKTILQEIFESEGFLSKEVIRTRKDNSTFPAIMNAKIISDGETKLISVTVIDITDRKNYEKEIVELNRNLETRIAERTSELAVKNAELSSEIEIRSKAEFELIAKSNELENFFTVTIDLLSIANVEGKFLKLNKAWENTLGYRIDELENHSFLDFVHPDDLSDTLDALKQLSDNNPVLRFTNRYRTQAGDYRFIEWHSVPVGSLIYSAARDITERIRVEDALKEAQVLAETANQSKSEFLSRMSHELRTPLNSILGFAQLLEMGKLEASQEKGVHHILKSGKHLLNLINEVLDISKIESGQLSISIEPVELNFLIKEVYELLHATALSKNIVIHLSDETKIYVKADKQRLKQILINLLNNAIKYNKNGGNVWISTTLLPGKGSSKVKLIVKDDGFGISEENLERIFNPFERVGAEKTNIEGTGLGLSVVKKLAGLLGANIGVESKLNEGSTFWIELPKTESEFERLQSNIEILGLEGEPNQTEGVVLYIEDTHSNIELVKQIMTIKLPDVKLIIESYGNNALEMTLQSKPDLILLDLNLPDIHGTEVLKQLKNNSHTSHIPVVIISADIMNNQLEKLMKAGAANYFVKPIDVKSFIQEVVKYVNLNKSEKPH